MKWAPNKKLHFEVAIIKAIQSLGQATLDEVIEKLGELRDGSPRPESIRTADKKSTAEKKTLGAEVEASNSPSSVEATVLGAAACGASVSDAEETAISQRPPTMVAETSNGETDPEKIWEGVYAKIPNTKAFVRNSAAAAHVLPSEGRHF